MAGSRSAGSLIVIVGVVATVAQVELVRGLPQGILYSLIGAAATALIVVATRRRPLFRVSAWRWVAFGLLLTIAGDTTWLVFEELGIEPFPSIADAFYLTAYPVYAYALWQLGRGDRRDVGSLLDALIIGVAAAVLGWIYLLAPYADDAGLTTVERLLSMAYPAGDLVLVPLLIRLVLSHGAHLRAHVLLLTGMAIHLVADVLYGTGVIGGWYQSGGWLDALWLFAYLVFAAAVWDPSAAITPPAPSRQVSLSSRRLAALAAASVLAPTMLLIHDAPQGSTGRVAAGASIVLFLLVVQRMTGLMQQIRQQADEMQVLATTDPLTGAANRRHLDEVMALEVARAERYGYGLTVALLDLDHFKTYNDVHGHPAGDALLQDAVVAWKTALRSVDLLARYGGEEFVVVLPGCELDDAGPVVDRLRDAVPEGRTCSAGVAGWEPGLGVGDLIDRADRALYDAKRAGRDRTVLAGQTRSLTSS